MALWAQAFRQPVAVILTLSASPRREHACQLSDNVKITGTQAQVRREGASLRAVPDHDATIQRFYAAFAARDGASMAGCYATDATFTDPVFVGLRGAEVGGMWTMLTSRAKDLRIELVEHSASGDTGTARWIAHYSFAQTGRPVVNDVRSSLRFDAEGLIVDQRDEFDFWRWSRQALGAPGLLLGWGPLQKSVQRKAKAGLDQFMQRNGG